MISENHIINIRNKNEMMQFRIIIKEKVNLINWQTEKSFPHKHKIENIYHNHQSTQNTIGLGIFYFENL